MGIIEEALTRIKEQVDSDIYDMESIEKLPPVILKNWTKLEHRLYINLCGNVYNHPNPMLRDGDFIYTSQLIWINEMTGIARTKNTLYILRDKAK